MGQAVGVQCGPMQAAEAEEECDWQPLNSAAADAADVQDKRDEPELLPVVASTDFTEVSRMVQIPQYRERAARASKGEYIEAKNVLRLGGLEAALRIYPHGDEDAPEGALSMWFDLAGHGGAVLSASVSFEGPEGQPAVGKSFSNCVLSGDLSLYGWTTFCRASDLEAAGCLLTDGSLRARLHLKVCEDGGSGAGAPADAGAKPVPEHVAQLRSDLRLMHSDSDGDGDVVLIAEGKEHKAHRAVLKARSPVLRAMLEADMAEKASGRIVIRDIDSDTVALLLSFLYTADISGAVAEMEDPPEVLGRLMLAADKYEVPNLVELCAGFLKRTLCTQSVIKVLQIAHELGNQELKRACLEYATSTAETLQAIQDSRDFESLQPALVREMFVHAHGNGTRRQAGGLEFSSLTRWGDLSAAQLQRACDERGLPSFGERAELLVRLEGWDGTRQA